MKEVKSETVREPFVLILGRDECDHVEAVRSAVRRRGTRVAVLDTTRFPREIRINYDPEGDIELVMSGSRFPMSACRSVYHPVSLDHRLATHAALHTRQRGLARQHLIPAKGALQDLIEAQLLVIVEVLIAGRQPIHALRHQRAHRMAHFEAFA